MENLKFVKNLYIGDGVGYLFETMPGKHPILAADKKLRDAHDGKLRRKIGISVSSGCHVGCIYCFTGNFDHYQKLRPSQMFGQVSHVMENPAHPETDFDETKISFKQMGDASLNYGPVCLAIKKMVEHYGRNLYFVVSTSAPQAAPKLFAYLGRLAESGIRIRPQLSLHTTSDVERKRLSPNMKMLSLIEIAALVNSWQYETVTLNFVMTKGFEYDVELIRDLFDPAKVFLKLNYWDHNKRTRALGLRDMNKSMVSLFSNELNKHGFCRANRHRL